MGNSLQQYVYGFVVGVHSIYLALSGSIEDASRRNSSVLKGKLGSRKIFSRMKVHIIKYLKIAMICSVISFVENYRFNKIVILLPWTAIFFPKMQARL